MLHVANKQIKPSGCGCGTSAALPRPPVYVVGSLGFDFGTEARRDALYAANGGAPITSGAALASFLQGSPADAASILWTLSDDQFPIYAVRPTQTYGADAYQVLQGFLAQGVDRISVPGWITGSARLMNGWTVPVIEPDVQGLRAWSTQNVVSQIASSGGIINVSSPVPVALPDVVNLTTLGAEDWAYWGYASASDYQHSAAGAGQISNWTQVGTGTPAQTAANPQYVFTWTNGAPAATSGAGASTAVSIGGSANVNSGFKFTVPADSDSHTLFVYVSASNAVGTLVASLTDGSAAPVSVSTTGSGPFVFTITYQGVTAGSLVVQWLMTSAPSGSSSIALQAAALQTPTHTALDTTQSDLQNFLNRIYFELRNKGVSAQERATNFAATQAYFVNNVITYAVGHGLNLQNVTVAHSPLCRPGSECWDVTLSFFDPQNTTTKALKVFRFIVDVSDVKPVMVGPMYQFNSY